MDLHLIALGYPFFVLLIVAEVLWSAKRGLGLYRFADAVTDLACGVGSQTVGAVLGAVGVAAYAWAYSLRVTTLPESGPWVWLAGFLYVDFVFYWWHRWSHEVHFLWAGHVVHHQSEDYNLAVALRQEWLTHLTHVPFYVPLALVGFPWQVLATNISISLLYQFWIHTEVIRRMGPYEWVFNAPMHHRVHHAINPQYLDKNYGGILIVWDRLFGTYQEEDQPCVYGTTTPIASWNTFWANWIVWQNMLDAAKQTAAWPDKLRVWWKSPAWSPPDLPAHPPHEVDRASVVKYDTPVPKPLAAWLSVQFLMLTGGQLATVALFQRPEHSTMGGIAGLVWTAWGLLNLGGLLDGKDWAAWSERRRLELTVVLLAVPILGISVGGGVRQLASVWGLYLVAHLLLRLSLPRALRRPPLA